MAFVELIEDTTQSPETEAIFSQVQSEYGFVPNILRAMAHCPDLLTTFVPLWAQVYKSQTIGPRLRALAALGTAKAQECSYCMAHMTASARRAGIADEQIGAVGDSLAEQSAFDSREALILEAADALTRDSDGITDEMRARLMHEFTPAEIVNIVLAIGMYNLTSRFLKALDIDVETVFQSGVPQHTSSIGNS